MWLQKIRWILLAGAMLLLAILAAFIIYGHHRALKAYRQIVARSGVSLTHDSNGVTWSQSVRDRKLYTIRAKTESSLGGGRYALRNAELLLYTRSEEHPDRIYGSQMEYDQNDGILRAQGEVFMEIQPPQVLSGSRPSTTTSSTQKTAHGALAASGAHAGEVIHVRTSGLVYVRKLGVASTREKVYIGFGGIQCSATGADFSSDQSTLRLLSDVQMDGVARNHPMHIIAAHAEMDRNSNVIQMAEPVVTSEGRIVRAQTAVLHLRKDGSIEQMDGKNGVQAISGTEKMTANNLTAAFTAESVLRTARVQGDVLFVDTNPLQMMHGSASTVNADFDPEGAPATITAIGSANLSLVDRRRSSPGLTRSMKGDRIVAQFIRGQRRSTSILTEVHATGSASILSEMSADPRAGAIRRTGKAPDMNRIQVGANDLSVAFATEAGRPQPQTLHGTGNTLLQQDEATGAQETSTGDTLQIVFAPATTAAGQLSVASAVQTGNVRVQDRGASNPKTQVAGAISNGSAEEATYVGSSGILTLTGNAHLYGDGSSVAAPTVAINQKTQDAYASGGVQTSFQSSQANGSRGAGKAGGSSASTADSVIHILSASARFLHDRDSALFLGTDQRPAFMWQMGSQIKAATLFFDRSRHTFSATPEQAAGLGAEEQRIQAVFTSAPSKVSAGSQAKPAAAIDITSGAMTYDELKREAVFSKAVVMHGAMGQLRGSDAVVFLSPAPDASPGRIREAQKRSATSSEPNPFGGSVERIVVHGDVRLNQPGRYATGEQLVYDAAKETYILTGSPSVPPRVVDEHQGSVTGKTLIFASGGSTIVVAGDATSAAAGARVRTETTVSRSQGEKQ